MSRPAKNRSARAARLLVALAMAAMAVTTAGCATTGTTPPAPAPEPPPSMRMIESGPEPDSAVVALNKALADLKNEKVLSGRLTAENAELREERDGLQHELSDAKNALLALRTRVDELARDQDEAMGALLASEIEKATLERRLLEIRLADLRKAEEEASR